VPTFLPEALSSVARLCSALAVHPAIPANPMQEVSMQGIVGRSPEVRLMERTGSEEVASVGGSDIRFSPLSLRASADPPLSSPFLVIELLFFAFLQWVLPSSIHILNKVRHKWDVI